MCESIPDMHKCQSFAEVTQSHRSHYVQSIYVLCNVTDSVSHIQRTVAGNCRIYYKKFMHVASEKYAERNTSPENVFETNFQSNKIRCVFSWLAQLPHSPTSITSTQKYHLHPLCLFFYKMLICLQSFIIIILVSKQLYVPLSSKLSVLCL